MSYNEQIFLTDLPEELIPSGLEIAYIVDVVNNISKKIVLNNLPISVPTQTVLNTKEPLIIAGTTTQYYRGDKTFQILDKTAVGLNSVDNTSDLDKPISTTTQTALNSKQNLLTNNSVQDNWLSTNVTLQGNTFNGVNQLVKLDESGKLPAIDGSQLTGLVSAISSLSDVTINSLSLNQLLQYNGTKWINVPASSVGATSLSGLNDILFTTPTTGQALFYDGTKWVNQYVPDNALWGNISGTLSNQTDLQNALNLKQNNLTVKPNEGITLDVDDNIGTIYNTAIADTVNSVAVGGAVSAPASSWKTKNIVQVLDSILFPDQLPTYTNPTISLSASQTGTREIGSTISQVLTVTANKNDAGIYTQLEIIRGSTQISVVNSPTGSNITDIAAQFGYPDPNNPNIRYTLSFTDSFVVVSGATNWKGEGNYQAGLPKLNNKGVTDTRNAAVRNTNSPQAASNNFATSNQSVTGIYPYFWGVSDTQPTAASIAATIAAGGANKVLAAASGTVTVTFAATAKFLWMVHAASYTTKTKWFNTALNNGNIGANTDLFGLVLTQAVNSPNGFWSDVNFKMYISTFATSTSGSIEFRNS